MCLLDFNKALTTLLLMLQSKDEQNNIYTLQIVQIYLFRALNHVCLRIS